MIKVEDKELLIKDLCARLPYRVKFKIDENPIKIYDYVNDILMSIDTINGIINNKYYIEDIKPYLFPMSSMTEKQVEEHCDIFNTEYIDVMLKSRDKPFNEALVFYKCTDWLNANHFDYRGLIEKGLAIDATNLNIY